MPVVIKKEAVPAKQPPKIHAHVGDIRLKPKLVPPKIDPKIIDAETGIPAVLMRKNWVPEDAGHVSQT